MNPLKIKAYEEINLLLIMRMNNGAQTKERLEVFGYLIGTVIPDELEYLNTGNVSLPEDKK